MTHDEALAAIVGCARTVTVLSYEEAIVGYLHLRGMLPAQGTEAGTAETGTSSVHDGPAPEGVRP